MWSIASGQVMSLIDFETVTTSDSLQEDGSVCGVEINLWDFEKGDKVDPDDEVLIEYYVYEEPSPPFILPMIVKLPKMVIQESFHIKVGAVLRCILDYRF